MNNKALINCLTVAALGMGALPAFASSVVWDWSPATTGATITSDGWTNQYPGQHFGEMVSFGADTTIDGMDIYSSDGFGVAGSPAKITVWADNAGAPAAILAQFSVSLSAVDSLGASAGETRKHADFGGFTMLANTNYWIGMAGDGLDLTQTGLQGVSGGDSKMAQFGSFGTFDFFTGPDVGDMAFRLYGNAPASTPEPSTLSLALLSLGGIYLNRRKQHAKTESV